MTETKEKTGIRRWALRIILGAAAAVVLGGFLIAAIAAVFGGVSGPGVQTAEITPGAISSAPNVSVGAPSMGYSTGSSGGGVSDSKTTPSAISPLPPTPSGGGSPAQNKIIKSGTATIETDAAYAGLQQVKSIADHYGAFFENESMSKTDQNGENASIVVRVPSDKFDSFILDLNKSSIGRILNMDITQSDQSRTYQDMNTQLKSAEAELTAVEALLKQAHSIGEILSIRQQSSDIRAQVDQLKSQLSSIDNQVSYSTLSIDLQSPARVVGAENWWTGTMQRMMDSLQGTVTVLLVFLTMLLPWLLLATLGYSIVRLIRGFWKRRTRGTATE
jgi:hypothetical protein